MELEEIKKRMDLEDIDIIPGTVYDVFTCCIQPHKDVKTYQRATKGIRHIMCKIHRGRFVTKYRVCPNCYTEITGKKIQGGAVCAACRPNNPLADSDKAKREHPRGRYCKNYRLARTGCNLASDCWYCDKEYDPIFPNTGPKRRTR